MSEPSLVSSSLSTTTTTITVTAPPKRKADAILRRSRGICRQLVPLPPQPPPSTLQPKKKETTAQVTTCVTSSKEKGPKLQQQLHNQPSTGRGSVAGWTTCPLCCCVSNTSASGGEEPAHPVSEVLQQQQPQQRQQQQQQKWFALGRGIAAHLHAVHTPWRPGKAELKKRKRLAERCNRRRRRRLRLGAEKRRKLEHDTCRVVVVSSEENEQEEEEEEETTLQSWKPTQQEIDRWEDQVLQIVQELEDKARRARNDDHNISEATEHNNVVPQLVPAGRDRDGSQSKSYRDSLPSFLQAAAEGDLQTLHSQVNEVSNAAEASGQSVSTAIIMLLDTRDRHLSIAEHWAAGSGKLDCLRYLTELRCQHSSSGIATAAKDGTHGSRNDDTKKVRRRRDGKTSLHYAARNGHVDCLQYLLQERSSSLHHQVDEISGEGTTPFHLACYGGHLAAAHLLLKHGANVARHNDWGCTAAHWVAMTRCQSDNDCLALCRLLQQHGVSFIERQKQGHSALHKAAQHRNKVVIEWLAQPIHEGGPGWSEDEKRIAGQPDDGGHSPSDIWLSAGGDKVFAQWMREVMRW